MNLPAEILADSLYPYGDPVTDRSCPGSGAVTTEFDPPGPQAWCPVCEQVVDCDDGELDEHPVPDHLRGVVATLPETTP